MKKRIWRVFTMYNFSNGSFSSDILMFKTFQGFDNIYISLEYFRISRCPLIKIIFGRFCEIFMGLYVNCTQAKLKLKIFLFIISRIIS